MKGGAYAGSGVDLAAVKDIHGMMAASLAETFRYRKGKLGEPLLGIGHYAGVIRLDSKRALTLHVDGVGTKVLVAQQVGKYDTVGIDCIAMTVNDLICLGSEPVGLIDYLALEREDKKMVGEIVKGLRAGAKEASVPIVGGETAIMGDVIRGVGGHGFDLAAMGIGVVETEKLVDGSKVSDGDEVIGLRSTGLHSNGYTLVRSVFRDRDLGDYEPILGRTLGEELLTPTRIYVRPVLSVLRETEVHGMAHITGGAFSKLTRLTKGRALRFRLAKKPAPPIFGLLKKAGKIEEREMYRTFNMGFGFCFVAPRREADKVIEICKNQGVEASRIGRVDTGRGVYLGKLKIA